MELAQVIGQLRQELSAAMRDGEGEDLRFELGGGGPVRPDRAELLAARAVGFPRFKFKLKSAEDDQRPYRDSHG